MLEAVFFDNTIQTLRRALDVPSGSPPMTFAETMHALADALRRRGETAASELLASELGYDRGVLGALQRDATKLPQATIRDLGAWLLAHRLLEDAFPETTVAVRGTKLRLEILQLYLDYPPVVPDEHSVVTMDVESFCLRVIAEAASTSPLAEESSPLIAHFEQYAPGGWALEDFGAERAIEDVPGIIWSADLVELRELTSDPLAGWWSEDPYAAEPRAIEDPTRIDLGRLAIYEVVIHPHWIPKLTTDVFGSRAYGVM